MSGFRKLFAVVSQEVTEIEPAEAVGETDRSVFLDVREMDEYDQGAVPGAVHIPRGFLETQVEARIPDHATRVIVYCAGGTRSAFAAKTLQDMGYTDVVSLAGGFNQWKDEGHRWTVPRTLTPEQRHRYHRHTLIPEVGEDGQQKLLGSKALVVGAGGLGSPAILYLAAAGVGTLGVVDMDEVDESNLQRQILHGLDRLGERKVDSAKRAVALLNPDVNVVGHDVRLVAENVRDIVDGYDVIVDGTDNFPTRYLLNDVSLLHDIPVVHGSIFRFEGQVTVFAPYRGPCYRCVFPLPPPAEMAPSCAEAGVLGALPGIVGSIQAIEAIKILLGLGDALVGRLLSYDSLEQSFRTYRVRPDPKCPACGPGAVIALADHDDPPGG
jgi:molybdopterin/thiamine biosynthesis adenylyltransferase/rhodanese-related sulfurtransferase